jgi:signal transduction histidine kinase
VYLVEDKDGSIWVSNQPKTELIRIIPKNGNDIFEVKEQITYTHKDGLPSVYFYPFLTGDDEVFFLSNIGVIQFDQATQKFKPWRGLGRYGNHLLNAGVSNFFKNKYDGSFYLQQDTEANFNIIQFKPLPNGDTLVVTKPFKRFITQLGLVDAFAFLSEANGNIWLGGNAYIVRYNANEDQKNYEEDFSCLIRKVTLDDSVLFGGNLPEKKLEQLKPKLLYDSGNLIIRYAAPFYDHEDKTLYSYKLEGLDKTWSPWQKTTQREYQHLSEGNYLFLVKAKNTYGNESNESSYAFAVLPPWYRTWWAYTFYVILFGIFVIGLVRLRTSNLQRKKKDLEEIVEEKTQELQETNQQLITTNNDLETSQEELRQSNDELVATNEYLKRAQRQLVESEKMASLGQLTAGIAHEINNPINFISGGVQAMNAVTQQFMESKERTPEKLESTIKDIQELMSSINNGVNRTASIITSLKTFTSPSESIDTYIDVTDCIHNSIILLKRKLADHAIEMVTHYGHKARVLANSAQLSQVLINLLDNAIHSLKDVNGARKVTIQTSELKNELLIQVRDNGIGIAEKDIAHIFEPFFTTKEVGAGVGLGLSISYSIIEKHKGKISCISKAGEGTEFTISLPIS